MPRTKKAIASSKTKGKSKKKASIEERDYNHSDEDLDNDYSDEALPTAKKES